MFSHMRGWVRVSRARSWLHVFPHEGLGKGFPREQLVACFSTRGAGAVFFHEELLACLPALFISCLVTNIVSTFVV